MDHFIQYYHEACRSIHVQNAHKYANDISNSAQANPRTFLYGTLFALASIWLFVTAVTKLRRKVLPSNSRPQTPDPEKKAIGAPPGGFKFAMRSPGGSSIFGVT
jgi:hypothetical protein